jgi:ketosteroid isomerase-like protein
MSERVVREFLARVNRGDHEGAMELVSPDARWHSRKGSYEGRDASLAFICKHGPQEHIVREIVVERVVPHGEHLVLLLDVQTRWEDEDVDSTVADHSHVGAVVDFRDGLIQEWSAFPEPEQALEAAGLT